jgi:hypothetical protein
MKVTSDGKEVMTWADIPPETAEHGYRRGYRDGWAMALEAIWDAMQQGYSRSAAYDLTAAHGDGPLLAWVRRGNDKDDPEEEWPPAMAIPKRARKG